MNAQSLKNHIHTVVDFPSEGIRFRDITPLLANPQALALAVDCLAEHLQEVGVDVIAAVEARGFLFGPSLAMRLNCPLVPVRKAGKLPRETARVEYALEYGSDVLEIHKDDVKPGQRFAVVDDVLATGGTAAATAQLIESAGGEVACLAFLMELEGLPGRETVAPREVRSVLSYGLDE